MGLVAGVLGGLLGIGGGALIVPGLVFFLNFDQHRAHGTSLVAALMLSVAGVATYFHHGYVDIVLSIEIAAGGVVGAVIGANVANAINGRSLRRVFSVFIVIVGIRMMLGGCLGWDMDRAGAGSVIVDGPIVNALVVIGTGVLTGFMSGLLGIGGGMVMIPALVILLCVSQKAAQGVSLAAILPTAFTGMLMHRGMGNVDFRVGKWVGLGAALGAFAGASVAAGVETKALKIIFGVFLLVMAALMAVRKKSVDPQSVPSPGQES